MTPERDRGVAEPLGTKKTAAPVRGRAVSARGTTPLRDRALPRSPYSAKHREVRDGGSITGAGLPKLDTRRRLLRNPVRGGARRSSSPAFLVPLCSVRGSLARSSRLRVLVIASVFDCDCTVSRTRAVVKSFGTVFCKAVNGFTAWRARSPGQRVPGAPNRALRPRSRGPTSRWPVRSTRR